MRHASRCLMAPAAVFHYAFHWFILPLLDTLEHISYTHGLEHFQAFW